MIDTLDHAHQVERPAAEPSSLLSQRINALRRRHVSVAVLTGLAIAISVAIELLALEMFADWSLNLSWNTRLILLIAQIAVQVYILGWLVVVPILRQPDDDEV